LKHPRVVIATPHIAGHSLDGKAANTQYIYDALCRYLDIEPVWSMDGHLPVADAVQVSNGCDELWRDTHAITTALYPIMQDDAAMRSWATLSDDGLSKSFQDYRRNYPVRRSWQKVELAFTDKVETALFKRVVHAMHSHLLGSSS
jgi:erythronate-4-phosphate dehydrogenase